MSETIAPPQIDSRIQDKSLAEEMAYAEKPHRDAAIQALKNLENGASLDVAAPTAKYLSAVEPRDTFAVWQELQSQEQPESITESEVEEKSFSYQALVRSIGKGLVRAPIKAGRKVVDSHNSHHKRKAEEFISERIAEEEAYQQSIREEVGIRENSKKEVESQAATETEPEKKEPTSRYRRPHSKNREPKKEALTKEQVAELAEAQAEKVLAERKQKKEAERSEQERRYIAARIAHGDGKAAKESIHSFGMLESRRLVKQIIARTEVEGGKKLTQIEKDKLRKSIVAEIDLHNKSADRLRGGAAPLLRVKKGEIDHNALAAQAVEHNRRYRALKSRAFH